MTDREMSLRKEVTYLNRCLRQKNQALDALGYVWCSGGCKAGVFRYHENMDLSEGQVRIVEQNTLRLRHWFEAQRCRTAQSANKSMDKCSDCTGGCFETN